jgi:hypothetical protein
MFDELQTNEKLKGKSITTLRGRTENYYYDVPNWENQKIGGGARLNINAHLDCFLNIVTETLFDNESIFISSGVKPYEHVETTLKEPSSFAVLIENSHVKLIFSPNIQILLSFKFCLDLKQ